MGLDKKEDLISGNELGDGFLSGESSDENWDDWYMSGECSNEILDGFRNFRALNCEMGNTFDSIMEERQKGIDNIADLLPTDPFNMEFSATISGWIEDLEKDFGLKSLGFVDSDEVEVKKVDNQLVTEVNFVWNSSVRLGEFDKNSKKAAMELGNGSSDDHLMFDGEFEETMCISYEKFSISSCVAEDKHENSGKDYCDDDDDGGGGVGGGGGSPPDALYYALYYLEAEDLLCVERVCKDLHNAVRDDPLLWRSFHMGHPLCYKITNDALLRLTDRARGTLQSLSLVNCLNITPDGLTHVLIRNPYLTKLGVPGCLRLRADSILCNLRVFRSRGMPGIKHLRIGGIYGVTHDNFEEFKVLLGVKNHKQSGGHKPRFYVDGQLYVSIDDELALDIDTCPRCQNVTEVYDCPLESCQGKHQLSTLLCRACILCIPRCINCGRCLNNCDYEETFCFDLICLDCWKKFLELREMPSRFTKSPKRKVVHQQASYHSTGSFMITYLSV